jgi:predicted aspartyl protease
MSGKFRYTVYKDELRPSGVYKAPFVRVHLAYGDKQTSVAALIDTGAADCLFDSDVANDLGLDIKDTDTERDYFGIGGQSVVGYIHKIELRIEGYNEWIEMEAGFFDHKMPYPLLGETGFFDNYEVRFMRYHGRFEVKSRTAFRR